MTMTAKPGSIPLGPLSRYVEPFAKDGSTTHWAMRRDIKMGRTSGQLYFTACGTLIFRVFVKGLFSNVEYVCEDYSTLEEGGKVIASRQTCVHLATGRTAEQFQIGRWMGLVPPPGHA